MSHPKIIFLIIAVFLIITSGILFVQRNGVKQKLLIPLEDSKDGLAARTEKTDQIHQPVNSDNFRQIRQGEIIKPIHDRCEDELNVDCWMTYHNFEDSFRLRFPPYWSLAEYADRPKDMEPGQLYPIADLYYGEELIYLTGRKTERQFLVYRGNFDFINLEKWLEEKRGFKTHEQIINDFILQADPSLNLKPEDLVITTDRKVISDYPAIVRFMSFRKPYIGEGGTMVEPTTSKDVFIGKDYEVYHISFNTKTEGREEVMRVFEKIAESFEFID